MATAKKEAPEESYLPPEDNSTEGWDTVRGESPTVVVFDTFGDRFTGTYQGPEVIENPSAQEGDDKEFTRHNFTGLDGKPYAINDSYALGEALRKADAVGLLTRITYVKDIPSKRGNPLKDLKVEVKRS